MKAAELIEALKAASPEEMREIAEIIWWACTSTFPAPVRIGLAERVMTSPFEGYYRDAVEPPARDARSGEQIVVKSPPLCREGSAADPSPSWPEDF